MNKSFLVNLFGFSATLLHGDTLVLDRWRWLKARLPRTRNGEFLLDVGCGSGAFTIGAALRGYESLGLSWDERNQNVAAERARICGARSASFEVMDVRNLHERADLVGKVDVVICLENIEHIIDDEKLLRDMSACLKPGGRLLLTTPNVLYNAISREDMGPFSKVEDGWHVRKGYSGQMLRELCDRAGLKTESITFCSGLLSQKITALMRQVSKIHPIVGWAAVLSLRVLPPVLDGLITKMSRWPSFSICLEAYKPRFSPNDQ